MLSHSSNTASFLRLFGTGELLSRVEELEALLERCTVCPRDCLNNRLEDDRRLLFGTAANRVVVHSPLW